MKNYKINELQALGTFLSRELPYFDVREAVLREVADDAGSLAEKEACSEKKAAVLWKEFKPDYELYQSTGNLVLKTAIGKKWAQKSRYDFDYDNSLLPSYVFCKTVLGGKQPEIRYINGYECKILCAGGDLYRGDTMNSWATTLREFFSRFNKEKRYLEYLPESRESIWKALITPENYRNPLPAYITEFMKVVYTIGNFTPIPWGLNGPRGLGNTEDYWDLALLCFYNWYLSRDDESLKKLLQNREEAVSCCKNWLDGFGTGKTGWNRFVHENFMAPFVDGPDEDGFGKPKELWEGHFEGNVKPGKQEEFMQFFVNAKERILERGKLISEAFAENMFTCDRARD